MNLCNSFKYSREKKIQQNILNLIIKLNEVERTSDISAELAHKCIENVFIFIFISPPHQTLYINPKPNLRL